MPEQHSPTSSYAETECADSDIDSNDCQRHDEVKCSFLAKDVPRVWVRTAPISIPSWSRQHLHSDWCENVVESPGLSYHADMQLLRAGRYLHVDEDDCDELDEDDPAFYGNLAFFRSQHGVSQSCMTKSSTCTSKAIASPASPTGVDDRDEDIFAMEL
ncbi:unnamed protein product [Peronospora belbahrii]|uniref:Uncharacterized protein n=1 Tax=Peronospora belbahrii TaxID=622444 RepID=A0AAU9KZM0_9STRA|nr:unnamed protein product [Peronospora belbahrii]CAH0517122.1 unnamed protein product [Peronospora belbahrii]